MKKNGILIIDFGSQYVQLLARRIRELSVYCEIFPYNVDESCIKNFCPNGIILSGGPFSVTELNSPTIPSCIFDMHVPILGICYGMQAMVSKFGGIVVRSCNKEFGNTKLIICSNSEIISGINDYIDENGNKILNVWMSHNDSVISIPTGFKTIALSNNCGFGIISNEKNKLYGIQFHPEVTHTLQGINILKRFVTYICECSRSWITKSIIDDRIEQIRQTVTFDKVILSFSGGLDSCVTAILLHKAIGHNLYCLFIDNGMLHTKNIKRIHKILTKKYGINIISISAAKMFFNALKGVFNPENKRKIIGKIFANILQSEAAKLKNIKWLAQGTVYSDIIESRILYLNIKKYTSIKSHHNVGGLPKRMNLKLIEPLKSLFKDEVKKIGSELGIPDEILYQYPFPGPGFGIRILGEVKKSYCDLLRKTDFIFNEEISKANLNKKISQAFTIFVPVKSVGIMGDKRKYGCMIVLRAIKTSDFMTATCIQLPYDLLSKVSTRIVNEVNGISRVVYDISTKPPSTIEWE